VNIDETLPECLSDVTELANIANAGALAIVDLPGNDDRLGIWTYFGSVDESNCTLVGLRLAGDDCTLN
jgi:hypothetical protein